MILSKPASRSSSFNISFTFLDILMNLLLVGTRQAGEIIFKPFSYRHNKAVNARFIENRN